MKSFERNDKIYGVSLENCKFCLFFAVDSDEIQSENLSENKQQNFLIRMRNFRLMDLHSGKSI